MLCASVDQTGSAMSLSLKQVWYLWEAGLCSFDGASQVLCRVSSKSLKEWQEVACLEEKVHGHLEECRWGFRHYTRELNRLEAMRRTEEAALSAFPEEITVRDSGDLQLAHRRFQIWTRLGTLERESEDLWRRCEALQCAAHVLMGILEENRTRICASTPAAEAPYALILNAEFMRVGLYGVNRSGSSSMSTASVDG